MCHHNVYGTFLYCAVCVEKCIISFGRPHFSSLCCRVIFFIWIFFLNTHYSITFYLNKNLNFYLLTFWFFSKLRELVRKPFGPVKILCLFFNKFSYTQFLVKENVFVSSVLHFRGWLLLHFSVPRKHYLTFLFLNKTKVD